MELNRPEVRNCVNHETALELYRLADSNNVLLSWKYKTPVFCLEKATCLHKCTYISGMAIRNIWPLALTIVGHDGLHS